MLRRWQGNGGWSYEFDKAEALRRAMLPLLKAAWQGDLHGVKAILKRGPELAKAKYPPSGSSYGLLGVWASARYGWHKGMPPDFDGATALHVAAGMGRDEVAALLLTKGAAVNARDRQGYTPLHCVAVLPPPPDERTHWPRGTLAEALEERQALVRRRKVLVGRLLAWGAEINAVGRDGDTPLAAAARTGNPTIARILLAQGARLDLFSAIRLGLLDRVEAMLKADPAGVNASGSRDASPLHVAAGCEHVAAIKLLLGHGAKPDTGTQGRTALGRAVCGGHTEAVRILLAAGARPNRATCWSQPALHYAARTGRLDIVKLLVAHGARLEAVDHENHTALFTAACAGERKTVEYLLDKGADINAGADRGHAPLRGVAYLARRDREVDPSGERLAKMRKMAAFLIARGATVDVLSAAGLGLTARLRAMLKADPAKANRAPAAGNNWPTPLVWAAARGQLAAAKLLLDAGAKVNAPSPRDQSTALHHAAGAGDVDMCKLLLARGANVHARTKDNRTPLHSAMWYSDNDKAARFLLDHGADPAARAHGPNPNTPDVTPVDVARARGHDQLVRLVQSYVKGRAATRLAPPTDR